MCDLKKIGFTTKKAFELWEYYIDQMEYDVEQTVEEHLRMTIDWLIPKLEDVEILGLETKYVNEAIEQCQYELSVDSTMFTDALTLYKDILLRNMSHLKPNSERKVDMNFNRSIAKGFNHKSKLDSLVSELSSVLIAPNSDEVYVYHSHNQNYLDFFDDQQMPCTRLFSTCKDDFGIGIYLNEDFIKAVQFALFRLKQLSGSKSYLKVYSVKKGSLPERLGDRAWQDVIDYHRHSDKRDSQNIQMMPVVRGNISRFYQDTNTYAIKDEKLQLRVYSCVEFKNLFQFATQFRFERE
eukprot:NODE_1002_length_2342_cov_0.421757.p1 type:complete len:295 gc:universal NODE_1002_length_2342_cov_0.421757:1277-393(-)